MEPKMFLVLFIQVSLFCGFSNATARIMTWEPNNPAFDKRYYEDVLDSVECARQISHIQGDTSLRLRFLEAGLRIPRSISKGNLLDMGDYHSCLGIHQDLDDSTVQGKYCMINVPSNQDISLPELPEFPGGIFPNISFPEGIFPNGSFPNISLPDGIFPGGSELYKLRMDEGLMRQLRLFMETNAGLLTEANDISRTAILNSTTTLNFRLAVCIPKQCTVREGLSGLLVDMSALGFEYREEFCRLPDDKPWATADYVAIVIFSAIGLLTVLSTLYDLRNHFILYRDPKSVNPLYTSFSVYTNARRLTTFSKNPGALECVDGIRAISMAWVIIGHTFVVLPPVQNVLDGADWQFSTRSLWITSAPLAVDTFFMMSGMLLVYTTAGKLTSSTLMRNLHLFYLNRILRMFPLLAAAILLQASFFHWMFDGPLWQTVANNVNACRNYWWLNFLYIQNFFSPMCISQSWYLAIDMQLHILSPILLYFVLSNSKRQAWMALITALLVTLTASSIYIFINKFPGNVIHPARATESADFMWKYYLHSLPRAAPFFMGMIFGYILHLCRHKPKFSKGIVLLLWGVTLSVGILSLFSPEPMKDFNYENQTLDSFVNAYARSAWAMAVACLIVLCVNGYGGPVNWLLSLQMWKLFSRISYAMYLFHYPLMYVITATYVYPIHFTVIGCVYIFFSQFTVSLIVGFFTTLIVDSPFSTIFKEMLGGGGLKKQPKGEMTEKK